MYRIDELLNIKGLLHSFSTVEEGNMSFKFDSENVVLKRREKFLERLNIDPSLTVAPYLQHTNHVLVVDEKSKGKGILDWRTAPGVDAMITNQRNTFLFMLVADCIPLIVYDSTNQTLGLIHVGWKGAENGIIEKTVRTMNTSYGTLSNNLVAAIGPCIRKDSYRFDDVKDKFGTSLSLWKDYLFKNDDGTTSIDLVSFVKSQLHALDVHDIIDCDIDTAKDVRFYSHYRDLRNLGEDVGRFACTVGLI